MNDTYLVDLTDSELASAHPESDDLVLRLAAAHVQQLPSREHGFVQHLTLQCLQARWEGLPDEAIGRIRSAQIVVNHMPARLVAPGQVAGPITLSLEFGFGAVLVIHAAAVEARFTAAPGFRESLAC